MSRKVAMWGGQFAIHCGGSPEKYPVLELWQPVVVAQRTERRKCSEVECTTVSEGTGSCGRRRQKSQVPPGVLTGLIRSWGCHQQKVKCICGRR